MCGRGLIQRHSGDGRASYAAITAADRAAARWLPVLESNGASFAKRPRRPWALLLIG